MKKEVRLAWKKIRDEQARQEVEERMARIAARNAETTAASMRSAKALAALLAARLYR